jgi:hypothetical protein
MSILIKHCLQVKQVTSSTYSLVQKMFRYKNILQDSGFQQK